MAELKKYVKSYKTCSKGLTHVKKCKKSERIVNRKFYRKWWGYCIKCDEEYYYEVSKQSNNSYIFKLQALDQKLLRNRKSKMLKFPIKNYLFHKKTCMGMCC